MSIDGGGGLCCLLLRGVALACPVHAELCFVLLLVVIRLCLFLIVVVLVAQTRFYSVLQAWFAEERARVAAGTQTP